MPPLDAKEQAAAMLPALREQLAEFLGLLDAALRTGEAEAGGAEPESAEQRADREAADRWAARWRMTQRSPSKRCKAPVTPKNRRPVQT